MQSKIHAQAMTAIEHALRRGPWHDPGWDERARRHGAALLGALRSSLATQAPMNAVAAACAAARAEVPLASTAWHEAWSRVALVWSVRAVLAAAHESPDAALRAELSRVASELAGAAAVITAVGDDGPGVPFDVLVETTRDAFARQQQCLEESDPASPFPSVYLQQLKHTASLLAVGGHSVDQLVRGAITRSERVARRDDPTGWGAASPDARLALVQHGIAEAAWALASHVALGQNHGEHHRAVSLWLTRTACQLLARVDRVEAWISPTDDPRRTAQNIPQPPTPPRAARPDTKTERTMDNTKLTPVLKTLEADASDAAWRLAGSQFVKLAREPIVALLSRHLGPDDPSMRGRVASFLDTELGAALLSSVLSVALSTLPLPQNDVSQKLARELRIKAMAGAGDVIADVLMGPLRQVAVMYLQGQPQGASAPSDPAALPGQAVIDALRVASDAHEGASRAPASSDSTV